MLMKLLLTIAVIIAVLYGAKAIQSLSRSGKDEDESGGEGRRSGRDVAPSRPEADELEKCEVCGTYVARGRAEGCGRDDCPYKAG